MIGEIFGQLFDIGVDVMATTIGKVSGVVLAQLGNSTTSAVKSNAAEWWQHAGFVSRSALPTPGNASCQALVLKQSDRDIVFASRDVRGTAILGNLADGEMAVYAPGSQAASYYKADGSVRLMTTDNNNPTNPTSSSVKPGNAVQLGISSLYQGVSGPAAGGEVRWGAPWGGAWHDPTGFHLRTWHGIKVDAGGTAGLSSVLGFGGGSTYSVSADTMILDAAVLVLGRNNGLGQALVQALPLQTLLQAFAVDLTTFAAALSTYASAIQATADPSRAATPALVAACTALGTTVTTLMSTVALACATKTTTAS